MEKETVRRLLVDHWTVKYILRPLVVIYGLLLLFSLFFTDSILFPINNNGHPHYQDTADILKLTTADGIKISAKYLPNPKAKYTIIEEVIKVENKKEKLAYYEVLLVTAEMQALEVQLATDGKILKEEKKTGKDDGK